MFTVTRSEHNPLLSPRREHPWEAAAASGGCPIAEGKKIRMAYQAVSAPELLKEPHASTSVIAQTVSADGIHFEKHRTLIEPSEGYDRLGCESPRVTKIGDPYYILYRARGEGSSGADATQIAVALSGDMESIQEKHLVTPFESTGMILFPEKIGGKMAALLSMQSREMSLSLYYAEFDQPEDLWSEAYWDAWQKNMDAHKISISRYGTDLIAAGAPPIKTEDGWLVVYSHTQRLGLPDQVTGIEAILLDLKNPRLVAGRTKGPFMVPEEYYEKTGRSPESIYPTGALIEGNSLFIYYSGAGTHCARASLPVDNLLRSLTGAPQARFQRFPGNPIIAPRPGVLWESRGTFNPAAIDMEDKTHILYRAVSADGISSFGYAATADGFSLDEHSEKPAYFPREPFELQGDVKAGYGCEDPRLVLLDDRLYMTYTAFNGIVPRVAIASISAKDFLAHRWSGWARPTAITPQGIWDKDAAILPEPFKGKYMIFHRINTSICADFVSSLDFSVEKVDKCIEILAPRRGMWDGGKVGIAGPPVRTKAGWLLLYHGVSWSTTYRIGAVLLDLDDPTVVIARTAIPLFEPEEEYECKGAVPNVVFPCNLIIRHKTAYLYYGAADSVVGAATIKLDSLLEMLKS